ncbi:MAG: OmpA family protein [Elusimicrobiota bacterium]|jgi:outer membrane protein OmpA-like peptidoglycan-associated protein|nr:OmpA family protein [Elusimicrobiota bacterium]
MKQSVLISIVAAAVVLSACTSPGAKTAIGAGAGAAVGAVTGAIIAHNTGGKSSTGAIVGGLAGATAGGLIGNYYDKQAKELAKIATVTKTDKGIEIVLKGEILFETGKSNLSVQAQKTLTDLNRVLKKYPANIIKIEGHTDSTGSVAANNALSVARAKAVYDYALAQGLKTAGLTYAGYGPANPIADNSTEAGRAKNRRVELQISTNKDLIAQYGGGD